MQTDNLFETIHGFISEELLQLDSQELKADSNLLLFGLDSLKMMRLVHFLESQFNITIPDQAIHPDTMRSVDTIVQLAKHYL